MASEAKHFRLPPSGCTKASPAERCFAASSRALLRRTCLVRCACMRCHLTRDMPQRPLEVVHASCVPPTHSSSPSAKSNSTESTARGSTTKRSGVILMCGTLARLHRDTDVPLRPPPRASSATASGWIQSQTADRARGRTASSARSKTGRGSRVFTSVHNRGSQKRQRQLPRARLATRSDST